MLSSIKKGQAAQGIVVTFIIAALLVTGIGIYFASMATNYPQLATNGKYAGVMANASAIYGQANSIQNTTEGVQENPESVLGVAGYTPVLSEILGLTNFIQSFFTAIANMSGLPIGWVLNFIVLLGIIILVFSVLNWLRGSVRGL